MFKVLFLCNDYLTDVDSPEGMKFIVAKELGSEELLTFDKSNLLSSDGRRVVIRALGTTMTRCRNSCRMLLNAVWHHYRKCRFRKVRQSITARRLNLVLVVISKLLITVEFLEIDHRLSMKVESSIMWHFRHV